MQRWYVVIALIILLSGCASVPSAKKTVMLEQGMTMQAVMQILGEPAQAELAGDKLVWKYDMYSAGSGMLPYYLIFDNSTKKLEKWYVDKDEYEKNREFMLRASPPAIKKDIDISVKKERK